MMAAIRCKLAAATMAGAAVAYFGHASLARAQTTSYSYDVFGRLSSVSTSGGAQTTYSYDAADNRSQVTKTSGAQVIGAVKHRKGLHWIQFAHSRKRPAVAGNSAIASAVIPTAPIALGVVPASSPPSGRIALAAAAAGR